MADNIEPCPRCSSVCTVGPRGTSDPKYPPDLHYRLVCHGKKCGYGLEGDTEAEAITAHNTIARQMRRAGALKKELEMLQWAGRKYSYGDAECPVCRHVPVAGHTASCSLNAALAPGNQPEKEKPGVSNVRVSIQGDVDASATIEYAKNDIAKNDDTAQEKEKP